MQIPLLKCPLGLLVLTFCSIAFRARADVVTDWNETALQAIRADKTAPPKAARALAILHASIYDAVNGITQTHERYLVSGRPAGAASMEAAVSAAARLALVRLFPGQQEDFDAAYQRAVAALPNNPEKNAGLHWGEWAANLIVVARATDGGEDAVAGYVRRTGPGMWEPTPAALAPALLPGWATVTCFTMTSGMQFRPIQPPVLTSAMYAFDFNLTKALGGKESTTRTAEQTAIAQFWQDGPGTVTPPGHWNVIAREVAAQRGTTMVENARLFALLNLALADAAICCWDCKYEVNFWRPITAIHHADSDRNPATEKDPTWMPLLPTPPFPEYTSGHSTFSSAAATVLAAFFGSDAIAFSTTSEAMQGFSRTYQAFSEAAAEAGMSRIYGGIHFMSANQQGLHSGARLGAYVMENFLKEKPRMMASVANTGPNNATTPLPVLAAQTIPMAPLPSSVVQATPVATPTPVPQAAVAASSILPPPAESAAAQHSTAQREIVIRRSAAEPAPTAAAFPPFPAAIPAADLDRSDSVKPPEADSPQEPSK